ncbi:MAG: hypothetical protein C3F12_07160 [Candidatus Methylomirabilota bacterium]|nr:hypothetical protein [Candidatus Methylomirabilis sp.]PWB45855.1 MAG: hypothetical protein C3F12_07160 [candidate division NC10 bacterium]
MKAGTIIVITLSLWFLVLPTVYTFATESATHVDIVQARFQQLLDQWGYREWWSMWEQGTRQSRSVISKDEFAQKMAGSRWQLACCDKRLRHVEIRPVSSGHVVVSATLLFETKSLPGSATEQSYRINLHFYLEEEQWRVDLSGLRHPT